MHNPGALRVLLYHRVADIDADRRGLSPLTRSADTHLFERQMRHLARAYQPVEAAELVAALVGRHTLPRRAVLVTFDDAYRDFAEVAWPILQQHRIPATLFVPTAYPDRPKLLFWWDGLWQIIARTPCNTVRLGDLGLGSLSLQSYAERLRAAGVVTQRLKALTPAEREAALLGLQAKLGVRPEPTDSVLSWNELRALGSAGVTIAAHSQTHPLLDQSATAAVHSEVSGSRDDLIRELGECPSLFAFPNGNFDHRTIRAVKRAGFAAAFSTVAGINQLRNVNPLVLRRDDGSCGLARFALNLLGPVGAARVLRHPVPTIR